MSRVFDIPLDENNVLTPDFCVIGGGSGGLSFAAGAVQMGASVILIERDKMGGDCLNYGCVPSKALISAAKSFHEIQRSELFGWSCASSKVDFKKVQMHVQGTIKRIAPNDSVERFEKLGVKVIKEEASFIDDDTVQAGEYKIKAKRFVISTGSSPFIPDIKGIDDINYLTNETIFDLKTLPKELVIIGGGPIGIELAQSFLRLGSKVTVLEAFSVLPKDDPEVVTILKDSLISEGLELKEGVEIKEINKSGNGCSVHFKHDDKEHVIKANQLLVAAGRRPNLDKLNLELANIKYTPRGIIVDSFLKSSNKRVFAIGDCIGGYQFTHVAGYHAGLVIRNSIFRLRSTIKTIQIPWVTYTDPEISHVGFTEPELKEQNMDYKLLSMKFSENDRAQAEHKVGGMIKVLVTPRGNILGATIIGSGAGELILPWVLAIQNDLKISAIAGLIAPYPTMSEISKRVAGEYYKDKIFSPWMQKIVKFLMRITQ
jgi:pyruvate/2-oxoglutarate dehydrogenase complex dihydrolipoamide dehydrogenase (E3) component